MASAGLCVLPSYPGQRWDLDLARLVHDRTTYTSMNEWQDMAQSAARPGIQPTLTSREWYDLKATESARRENLGQNAEMEFRRAYTDLTSKIAYLHPNPGPPRTRQGRIGGTWRHIKEVLGHSGNRVVFVNGLVSVYDSENFNQDLQAQLPYRPHLANPRYAPASRDLASYHQRDVSSLQNAGYMPTPRSDGVKLPSIATAGKVTTTDPDILRKLSLQREGKYKGVYRYK